MTGEDRQYGHEWSREHDDRLLVGEASRDRVRFVVEDKDAAIGFRQAEVRLEPRDWDVKDPAARERAGSEILGDDYEGHVYQRSAQWWIHPGLNAASLAVYRQVSR